MSRQAPKWWYQAGARVPLWAGAVAPLYASAACSMMYQSPAAGFTTSQPSSLPSANELQSNSRISGSRL